MNILKTISSAPTEQPIAASLIRMPFTLLSILVPTVLSAARQQPKTAPDPVPPYTSVAAARAVDRFIAAFNAVDSAGLMAAFAPTATASMIDLDDSVRVIHWLPKPWQYHQLQAMQLSFRSGAWTVDPGSEAVLIALERVVSGGFVTQREQLSWYTSDGQNGTLNQMAIYRVRNGRIHQIWIFPFEETDVPKVARPTYPLGTGPVVWMDSWHGNKDLPDGTYFRLAELLRRDGYTVRYWEGGFARGSLDTVRILVIANPTPQGAFDPARAAALGSAFRADEERTIEDWVAAGGSLLLIADHDPWAGAAASLAARFGAEFRNGVARDTARPPGEGDVFRRPDGTLRPHAITDGIAANSRVDSVVTFLGQAFKGTPDIQPLLVLRASMVLSESTAPGQPARRLPVGGWM